MIGVSKQKLPKVEFLERATEPQLRDYYQAGAVTATKIVDTTGGYVVVIQVSWKPGDIAIYSQRNRPRAWRSLDRLIAYLKEVMPTMRTIGIVLNDKPAVGKGTAANARTAIPARLPTARRRATLKKT